jgi:hypothetical protein
MDLFLLYNNVLLHLLVLDDIPHRKRIHLHNNNHLHHDLDLRDQFRGRLFQLSGSFPDNFVGDAGCGVDAESAAYEDAGVGKAFDGHGD